MSLKNGEQYMDSLRKMRPNIYKFGELIKDVTTHPATQLHIKSVAHSYDMAFDETQSDIFTTTSFLTGKKAHRWNTLMTCAEDSVGNARMKRAQYNWSGTCQGATCAGWTMFNSLYEVTYQMDKELGTKYHERLKKFILYAEENALALAGLCTDGKGDRTLPPSKQADPDINLHIVEKRPDGIVIKGCKILITGVAASNEMVIILGSGYGAEDTNHCVACAVPRDAEGITIVEARHVSDERDIEEGWDAPRGAGSTCAYILFENVFVPSERVFMAGEYQYSGKLINDFICIYRGAFGGCVTGQGDVMIGAAINVARANGLSQKVFQDKLTTMTINNETTFGMSLGSAMAGKKSESGTFLPNALIANVNKTHIATLPYETKRICQDICGGLVENGCIPSYADFQSPLYGEKLLKTAAGAVDGETRVRAARLAEWLTVGGGIPGCMHGGGSQDGAKLGIRALSPWNAYAENAKRIAGITRDLPDPVKKK